MGPSRAAWSEIAPGVALLWGTALGAVVGRGVTTNRAGGVGQRLVARRGSRSSGLCLRQTHDKGWLQEQRVVQGAVAAGQDCARSRIWIVVRY